MLFLELGKVFGPTSELEHFSLNTTLGRSHIGLDMDNSTDGPKTPYFKKTSYMLSKAYRKYLNSLFVCLSYCGPFISNLLSTHSYVSK